MLRDDEFEVDAILEAAMDPVNFTDLGNARRFAMEHAQDVKYCHPWRKWLIWDGKRWKEDDTGEIMRRAKETVRNMITEAAMVPDEILRTATQWALASASHRRIEAMIALARSEPNIPVVPEELDRDPWLLNVANGTIDLRTGELRPHRREDLLTKIAPVAYDPTAKCPRWELFLNQIMDGNQNLVSFLQRAVGYSLSASTREQVFFMLYGTGANGKSVFLTTLQAMMGDYAAQAAPDLLLTRQAERHPTEIADLVGRRLVVATETEAGRSMAESLVKQLTGQDRVKARRMREDFWEFTPMHKIWLATNHHPRIRNTDYAIWRRIRLVPFAVTIPPERQDRELTQKLQEELPGILAWAVRGCLDWQAESLNAPPEVVAATEAYRAEQDVVASFLAECCIVHPNARARAKSLYQSYVNWCQENGEHPMPQRAFSQQLAERGFERRQSTGGYYWWFGIGLVDQVDQVDQNSVYTPYIARLAVHTENNSTNSTYSTWKQEVLEV